ncbi:MAG: tRNA uridine-5-carboxymethylaminomethyl(34) synthesis GTPase MnmE [Gemmatimonadaceae bacterium]|nr:tRNA uridine-5-carboxymethylaminomethyl(34) synthesis GTPase MnmE [Gemmatimonadaceae bacterium]
MATAAGTGALAVLRVSGPAAATIAAGLVTPWPLIARRATRVRLADPDTGAVLDDAVATWFSAPHSFTGEDVLELSVHGGGYVSALVLTALVARGARPALPGEFTERAVRAGKLDVLQAEAIGDLIAARSRATHRAALRQLSGALTRQLAELREALLHIEALLAYEIDFPEEDDGPQPRSRATEAGVAVLGVLDRLLATLPQAVRAREGMQVVLAGAPNAGKSSLFNALLGDPRAIVSDVPGTTRDAIEAMLDADPWPWRLIDTAGLRDASEPVERLGVEVSERRLAGADVVLVCADDDDRLAHTLAQIAALSPARRVAVRTKVDDARAAAMWTPSPALDAVLREPGAAGAVAVSAIHGIGLDALRAALTAVAQAVEPEPPESQPMILRARHAAALRSAREEVTAFLDAWESQSLPAPVVATHLRAAVHAMDELMGTIDMDDILGRVFRDFCVGK